MLEKLPKIFSPALLLAAFAVSSDSFALDGEKNGANSASMHEVARQIRQYKTWQILEASPRTKKSGIQIFRFKLLNEKKGTIKIITIDPNNPSFRHLEQ